MEIDPGQKKLIIIILALIAGVAFLWYLINTAAKVTKDAPESPAWNPTKYVEEQVK
ncbi:MAG: hypothetical protein NTZ97_04630 [Candidatus Moranbacteria bacterium]|nr:hypothetical protein [Candidatus Moranbacteria bacterium]